MSGKIRGFILAAVIFVSAVVIWGVTQMDDVTYATAVGTIKVSGYLNVRKGPGTEYERLRNVTGFVTLSNDTQVTILAEENSWYKIRFLYHGERLTGYVSKKYLSVHSGDMRTQVPGVVSPGAVLVRSRAMDSGCVLKKDENAVKLSRGWKVRILSESIIYCKRWYEISFVYQKQRMKGYVPAASISADYTTALNGVVSGGRAVLKQSAGRTTPVYSGNKPVVLEKNTKVLMTGEEVVSGLKYIKVEVTLGKNIYRGYILNDLLRFQLVELEAVITPSPKPVTLDPVIVYDQKGNNKGKNSIKRTKPAATEPPVIAKTLSEKKFKKKMLKEGFPSSYIVKLMELHKKYPNWQFEAYQTGIDWSAAVSSESKIGLNLISNNKSSDWKSFEEGAYNWSTDSFIPFDGSTWVTASQKALKYYMDPRNFIDEENIFQFESLKYQADIQNQNGVENVLKNTPMYQASYTYVDDSGAEQTAGYSQTFMEAAGISQVSPYHLASRVKQEVVTGPTGMSSSVSGTVAGYEGIYNFYNIGANNSTKPGGAVANGLEWASREDTYGRPWNNIHKALIGGAQYLGSNYINVGQDTLYLQKFNVTPNRTFDHQYMANIEAPYSESRKTAEAYGADRANMNLVFSIPVYIGMPVVQCPMPSGGVNPNNYLKSLSVQGYSFDEPFNAGDAGGRTYRLTVGADVKSIRILAEKVSASATVTGDGVKKLKNGVNRYTVSVRAENGRIRKYKIKVTRKAA